MTTASPFIGIAVEFPSQSHVPVSDQLVDPSDVHVLAQESDPIRNIAKMVKISFFTASP
jgi:hypothetical protein